MISGTLSPTSTASRARIRHFLLCPRPYSHRLANCLWAYRARIPDKEYTRMSRPLLFVGGLVFMLASADTIGVHMLKRNNRRWRLSTRSRPPCSRTQDTRATRVQRRSSSASETFERLAVLLPFHSSSPNFTPGLPTRWLGPQCKRRLR
jgi:hypothetical protein